MEPMLADLLARGGAGRRRLLIGAGLALAVTALVVAVAVSAASAGGATVSVTAPAAVRPAPSPTSLLVQVTGAVRRPGLVSLPDGSRAVDAIAAAGGATAAADESAVNLAARVVDGQQLAVPTRGATPPNAPGGSAGPVSLSAATAEQLETLPRIGPALAARILAWRAAHGPFRAVSDLLKVGGIGAKTVAGLQGLVTP